MLLLAVPKVEVDTLEEFKERNPHTDPSLKASNGKKVTWRLAEWEFLLLPDLRVVFLPLVTLRLGSVWGFLALDFPGVLAS